MKLKRILAILMSAVMMISVTGCGSQTVDISTTETSKSVEETATSTDNEQSVDTQEVDSDSTNVRLEDDFYEYINADVFAQHEIPSTEVSWSWFDDMDDAI